MERDHLYRDYITVVFGLVATKGLEQLSESVIKKESPLWIQAPFFLGAFIVGIHYWYVCANFAGVSSTTYGVLSEKISSRQFFKNLSNIILFGLPVLFVSGYAGAVVMFFYAIPAHYGLLFRAFQVLLGISWINDAWDIAIAIYAKKKTNNTDEINAIENQRKLSQLWLILDLGFFVIFTLGYHWVASLALAHPLRDGALFLGLVAIGVLFDALLTPLDQKQAQPQKPAAHPSQPAPAAASAPKA
ncbi:MAG TPA: hypothetical protein VMD78_09925 [Candidatus Baltobacteraceae bacterium]|nr:hypothetical protein [Candidatus Baltobacteraceae bacterium]